MNALARKLASGSLSRAATVTTTTTTTTSNASRYRWGQLLPVRRHVHSPTPTHGQPLPNASKTSGTTTNAPKPRKHTALAISSISLASLSFILGALYPPDLALLLSPRPSPPPPDPSSAESIARSASLESALQSLPFLQRLRAAPDAEQWYETRPYVHYPEERRVNSLTAGALRGAGRLGVGPFVRARKDESESWVILHVGRGVCGHDGIVHGGLLATLLDEGMGRTAIMNLPEKVGVTATLTVDYKSPCKADQFIAIHTRLTELKGRKAYVEARIEDMNGNLIAQGRSLFVQPKYANLLHSAAVRKAVGERPHDTDSNVKGEMSEGYSAVVGDVADRG